jgi:WD40 repeat protein
MSHIVLHPHTSLPETLMGGILPKLTAYTCGCQLLQYYLTPSQLQVWTLTGEVLSELIGHTALVYAVAGSSDGTMVVSGSEDNTCRVWTAAGQCLQVRVFSHGGVGVRCQDGHKENHVR